MVQLRHDPIVNAAYIRFSPEAVAESGEVAPGIVLDYDAGGRIVGMEVLDARGRLSPALLANALPLVSVDNSL